MRTTFTQAEFKKQLSEKDRKVKHIIRMCPSLGNQDWRGIENALMHVSAEEIISRFSKVRGRKFNKSILSKFIPKSQPLFG